MIEPTLAEAPSQRSAQAAGPFRALSYGFTVASQVPGAGRVASRLLQDLNDITISETSEYRLVREDEVQPYALYVEGELVRRVGTELALVDELLWHVNREAIAHRDPRVAIHASAVTWNGRAVLFPAPAGSGKTTLAAALLMHGAAYVTDEAALIDLSNSRLHPYPKPLWMSPRSARALPDLPGRLMPEYRPLSRARIYVRPTDIGASVVSAPQRVSLIITPTFRQGRTTLEPISRSACLMWLATNSFSLPRFGRRGLLALSRLVEDARCYRLAFEDLSQAVELVDELVHGR